MTNEELARIRSLKAYLKRNRRVSCQKYDCRCIGDFIYREIGGYIYVILTSVTEPDSVTVRIWCKPIALDELFWEVFDMKESASKQPFSFHVNGAYTAGKLAIEKFDVPADDTAKLYDLILSEAVKLISGYSEKFRTPEDFKAAISERPGESLNMILCEILDSNFHEALFRIEECLDKNETGGYLRGSKSILEYAREYCVRNLGKKY